MFSMNFHFTDSLTKRQKASFLSFIRSFVKKHNCNDVNLVFSDFIDELKYETELENTRYFWVKEYLDMIEFQKDIELLVKNFLREKKYKNQQAEYVEKRKIYIKSFRQNMLKNRQSHEKPTERQIKYYNYLCNRYKVKKENINGKSKLDFINMINEILKEKNAKL